MYNNQPQGGYGQQQQQGGQQQQQASPHIEIELMAYLAQDPTSNQVGNELVGKSKVLINHRNGDTDSWFLDVWTNNNGQSRGQYDFLMNYCPKGKKVFIKGVPMLQTKKQQDGSYKSFPTIRVSKIVAADSAPSQGGGQAPQQQYQAPQQQQAPQYQQQQQPQYQQQAPAPGSYQPPAGPPQGAPAGPPVGQYQPPAPGGYQPPAQGSMPQPPAGPPAQGGYPPQPPTPGQYGAPAGPPVGAPYQP